MRPVSGEARGESKVPQQRVLTIRGFNTDQAQPFGQATGVQHADRNRFAVQQHAVSGQGLEGVRERVTVIQDRSQAGPLEFVLLDDVGFQAATPGNDLPQNAGVAAVRV